MSIQWTEEGGVEMEDNAQSQLALATVAAAYPKVGRRAGNDCGVRCAFFPDKEPLRIRSVAVAAGICT